MGRARLSRPAFALRILEPVEPMRQPVSAAALRIALAALALSLAACGDTPRLRGAWFQTSRADPAGSQPQAVAEPLRIVLRNAGRREVAIHEVSLTPPPGRRAALIDLAAMADLRRSGTPRLQPGQFVMLVIEPADVPAPARDGCRLPTHLFVRTAPQTRPRKVKLDGSPIDLPEAMRDCGDAEAGSQPAQ